MPDEQYTFTQARARLEEIVAQVRRKDVSLEASLDLLEEGVRLANACTEVIDHTEWRRVVDETAEGEQPLVSVSTPDAAEVLDDAMGVDERADQTVVATVEEYVFEDASGTAVIDVVDVEFFAERRSDALDTADHEPVPGPADGASSEDDPGA